MAGQVGSPVNDPISPHLVSSAFVQQYYYILHEQPEQVHKFYQDSSILGRPEPNGTMASVTTLAAINETIMAVDFRNCLIEIETADAQSSHKGGVFIVVTGSLTPSEGICCKFTQSFFLAPQESGGYFVLNDVLRFISDRQPAEINEVVTQENESSQIATSASETHSALPEPTAAGKSLNSDHVKIENNVKESQDISPDVNGTVVNYNATTEPPVQVAKEDPHRAPVSAPLLPTSTHRDVTKKSYASIVKDMKDGPLTVPDARTTQSVPKHKQPKPVTKDVEVPVKSPAKPTLVTKDVKVPVKSPAKPSPDNETIASNGTIAGNNSLCNEHGYSVFIRNLPFSANIQLLEEEFKKFGAVKPGAVQVVHHKFDGFCFGFVEFESEKSMQAAIEASPFNIREKRVFVEKKRTPTRVTTSGAYRRSDTGEGGRFRAGRGVCRGDNLGGGCYTNNENYRGGRDTYNHRNDSGENYNRRNDSGENYNRWGDTGENYNRRNDSSENYNRKGNMGENYNRKGNMEENYNRRNGGGTNYNHRNGGGESYNRRFNDGENYNRRTDVEKENFNPRNFRNQDNFSGGHGEGAPSGNGHHQNGNGFQAPRPVQNGKGRPARVNGPKPKQPLGAA